MKIDVELSIQSIEQAKKELKRIEKLFKNGALIKEYIKFVYQWVIDRANEYLKYSEIGENVKTSIIKGWQYQLTDTGAKITNNAEKAVFVEFGVGSVGLENPHKMVRNGITDYEYNIGSKIDRGTFQWIFNVSNDEDIDIQDEYIIYRTDNTVKTKGSPSVMYAYNAVVDARKELEKPNGVFASEWNRLLERYLG